MKNHGRSTSKHNRRSVIYGITIGKSASSFLRGQLAWMRGQGWNVTLVTSPDDAAYQTARRESVLLDPIKMERPISPLKDFSALYHWFRTVRRHRPNVINVSTPKAGLLGGLVGWMLRIPKRIYVVRGLRLEGAGPILSRVLWLMEWLTMQFATDVVFVSSSLADESRSRRLTPRGGSWTIGAGSSNGVDAAAVEARVHAAPRALVRREAGLTEADFVVGFIGRLTYDKGLDTLIGAFSGNNLAGHIKLLVIGPSEESEWVPALTRMGQRVRHVPWTDDVWGYLSAMDLLALPTRREGFPNVVLEAAAAGVPCVTTTATGAVDSVIDGKTGYLVPVGDVKVLAARIAELAARPDLLECMGIHARDRAKAEFSPNLIWEGLLEIMNSSETPKVACPYPPHGTHGRTTCAS